MARKLTALHKLINEELRKNNLNAEFEKDNLTAYTELDYRTKEEAIKLLSLKKSSLEEDKDCMRKIFKIKEYYDYIGVLANTSRDTILYLEAQNTVSEIFQIEHLPLIKKLTSSAYLGEASNSYTCRECGETINYKTNYVQKISEWVGYCKVVDNIKGYLELAQPNWDKLDKKDKKAYIHTLTLLANSKLMSDNNLPLAILIHFLENYQLNQTTLAKAKYLLKCKLPNIDDIKTAKNVVIHAKYNKIL